MKKVLILLMLLVMVPAVYASVITDAYIYRDGFLRSYATIFLDNQSYVFSELFINGTLNQTYNISYPYGLPDNQIVYSPTSYEDTSYVDVTKTVDGNLSTSSYRSAATYKDSYFWYDYNGSATVNNISIIAYTNHTVITYNFTQACINFPSNSTFRLRERTRCVLGDKWIEYYCWDGAWSKIGTEWFLGFGTSCWYKNDTYMIFNTSGSGSSSDSFIIRPLNFSYQVYNNYTVNHTVYDSNVSVGKNNTFWYVDRINITTLNPAGQRALSYYFFNDTNLTFGGQSILLPNTFLTNQTGTTSPNYMRIRHENETYDDLYRWVNYSFQRNLWIFNYTDSTIQLWFNNSGGPYKTDVKINSLSIAGGGYDDVSNLTLNLSMLGEGKVSIIFNLQYGTSDFYNWTQTYDFINDLKTPINQTMEILSNDFNALEFNNLRFYDSSGAPLSDVVVEVVKFNTTETLSANNMKRMTSRILSDEQGYARFWCDNGSGMTVTWSKTGYAPGGDPRYCGEEWWTRDDAYQITMKPVYEGQSDNYLFVQDYFYDTNDVRIIGMYLTSYNVDVYYTTDWAQAGGFPISKAIDTPNDQRYMILLNRGVHYELENNFTIYVYTNPRYSVVGNILRHTKTVEWAGNLTSVLDYETIDTTSDFFILLMFLIILFAVSGAQYISDHPNAGLIVFFIGIVFLSYWRLSLLIAPVMYALLRFGFPNLGRVFTK